MTESSTFERYIGGALAGRVTEQGQLLQLYRNYLLVLAASQLGSDLRQRLSPSDLVQEAMLAAFKGLATFRGGTEAEFLGWLRQILVRCLHRQLMVHIGREKRDLRREITVEQVGNSMANASWSGSPEFQSEHSSPSAHVIKQERAVIVANELGRLSPDHRDVVVLRTFQSLGFREIAEKLGKSEGAVRMCWLRAIDQLRKNMEGSELQS